MNVENYSERVHIARTHELASESQPYERVPNCLRFSFNNLFITCIYPKVRIDLQEPIDPGAPCRGFLKGIIF